jgi:hypothetical protein
MILVKEAKSKSYIVSQKIYDAVLMQAKAIEKFKKDFEYDKAKTKGMLGKDAQRYKGKFDSRSWEYFPAQALSFFAKNIDVSFANACAKQWKNRGLSFSYTVEEFDLMKSFYDKLIPMLVVE